MLTYYCDEARHLVCVPYSIAEALGIKRCWYHPSRDRDIMDSWSKHEPKGIPPLNILASPSGGLHPSLGRIS